MTNKKYKKSQMQIGETIAVLAVFFIIMMVTFVFFFRVIKDRLVEQKGISTEQRSVGVVQRLLSLPEIQCTNANVIGYACIDKVKMEVVVSKEIFKNIEYFPLFEWSTINVSQIYPERIVDTNQKLKPLKPWNLYSKPLDDYSSKIVTNIPLTIHDPINNKNNFGYIEVVSYSKS